MFATSPDLNAPAIFLPTTAGFGVDASGAGRDRCRFGLAAQREEKRAGLAAALAAAGRSDDYFEDGRPLPLPPPAGRCGLCWPPARARRSRRRRRSPAGGPLAPSPRPTPRPKYDPVRAVRPVRPAYGRYGAQQPGYDGVSRVRTNTPDPSTANSNPPGNWSQYGGYSMISRMK